MKPNLSARSGSSLPQKKFGGGRPVAAAEILEFAEKSGGTSKRMVIWQEGRFYFAEGGKFAEVKDAETIKFLKAHFGF